MSRQLDIKTEQRESLKRDELVKALEYGIVGGLQAQGIELLGFSLKYDAFNCLLTIRADVGGARSVCFIGSDSIINCFLKAQREANSHGLVWKPDQYHNSTN